MKRIMISLLLLGVLVAACTSNVNVGSSAPDFIETGVDTNAWATIPAGDFPMGQENMITAVDYDYQIMITDVTVEQYVNFLNEALASGNVSVGEFEVEAGEVIWQEEGVGGFYEGDPFDGYKHEEEVKAGNHLYMPLADDLGLRLTFDGQTFTAMPAYVNHPMTIVSWFGANAYCEYYGNRLPTAIEWEKAARGTEIVNGNGLPFAWGEEIHGNDANYYSSSDLFEKISGKLGNTTPVGFYNGKTYQGYETHDSASPYGLYDMGGNVWQWLGDDHPDQHYRHMRGGSFYTYEVDLRVWKFNSAGPQHYSREIGFRCASN
ncbi:MAG: formylglycine-generating enzyme family protein [Chloroflexi bacterium]|nr:formylglycine-generating enzyme family protein [Chloroflexota bacterium]